MSAERRPDRGRLAILPAVGLALVLPAGTAVYERPAGSWVLDLRPGMRQPRRVILSAHPGADLARPPASGDGPAWEGPQTRRLGEAGEIAYHTRVGGGGSGGVEADLIGRWTLRDRALLVVCEVQEEPILSEGPDPTFCLPLLADARAIPVTDGPPRVGPDIALADPLPFLPAEATPPR